MSVILEFNSYENFINLLKSFDSDNDKINMLMYYFLTNVDYDYTTLEACKINSLKSKDGKPLLDYIDENFDRHDLGSRLEAMRYANECGMSNELLCRIAENYGKEFVVPGKMMFGKVYPEKKDNISFTGATNLIEKPVVYDSGMIKKGVCADFAPFIKQVCDDLGIMCKIVEGISDNMVSHVWNIINGKHYDATYAIFVRDMFEDWDKKSNVNSWLDVSFDDILKLQPTRTFNKKTGQSGDVLDVGIYEKTN